MIETISGDCLTCLDNIDYGKFDLTFLDPPFNQGKEYRNHKDNLPESVYWEWMKDVCRKILELSSDGAALYFLQREKNTGEVLRIIKETGWTLQNLVIWKKNTSAIPGMYRFGKHYQIIAFATKGSRPRVFHWLRIDPPLPNAYRFQRKDGVYLTDVWDDIRELTSGYFAGDEALRAENGERIHKQQSPIHLLLRILLSSTNPGDLVLDPFAGTGTTSVVAQQLQRRSVGIEIDEENVIAKKERIEDFRKSDDILRYADYYAYTPEIENIWGQQPKRSKLYQGRSQLHLSCTGS
ncbi:MAG: site-specific DNA-methyltransferase [Candidatus Hatepunaea meridiana]|nr:site-specific DNA-methyltransferase [Candidatus Hatepunaea meridiana]